MSTEIRLRLGFSESAEQKLKVFMKADRSARRVGEFLKIRKKILKIRTHSPICPNSARAKTRADAQMYGHSTKPKNFFEIFEKSRMAPTFSAEGRTPKKKFSKNRKNLKNRPRKMSPNGKTGPPETEKAPDQPTCVGFELALSNKRLFPPGPQNPCLYDSAWHFRSPLLFYFFVDHVTFAPLLKSQKNSKSQKLPYDPGGGG